MPSFFDLNRVQMLASSLSDRKAVLSAFVLGFLVRLIPEVLSYPYPIGFDTIYYAAIVRGGVIWQHWTSIFSVWLLDAILISVHQATRVDPFVMLKLAAPILYGLNICGIYYFSRRALNWSVRQGLIASSFCVFQLALLRLSWDLYRNMLGSAVLLFTLPLVQSVDKKKKFVWLVLLSLLVVLSHILVSIVLFATIFGAVITHFMKNEKVRAAKVFLAILLALTVFLVSVFPNPVRFDMPSNVINTHDEPPHPGGLFFLVNYLDISDLVQNYPTYLDLVLHVFSLFSVLFLWWLPLVLVGFFRNETLDCLILVLFAGSFWSLITPFLALNYWNRWMFMLVYPFTFYAANGVQKISQSKGKSITSVFRRLGWIKVSRRAMFGMLSLTIVSGSVFMMVPPFFDRFGVFFIPTTSSYLPSTMLYNTVPLRDVESTTRVMAWLNENMSEGSSVLVNHAFLRWADLFLDKRHSIVYYVKNIENALNVALAEGYDPVYLVWWNEDFITWQNQSIGWYGITITNQFISIFRSDRISAFIYVSNK